MDVQKRENTGRRKRKFSLSPLDSRKLRRKTRETVCCRSDTTDVEMNKTVLRKLEVNKSFVWEEEYLEPSEGDKLQDEDECCAAEVTSGIFETEKTENFVKSEIGLKSLKVNKSFVWQEEYPETFEDTFQIQKKIVA